MTQNVTIFKNIKETEAPFHRNVSLVLDRIKDGATKELVKRIRKEKNKSERNELKKLLPAICFSGVFNKRADNALQTHSGIICLDFDGYVKTKELLQDKENLSKDKYVMSAFISPSGDGIKVLVKIPADVDNHVNYFNSLNKHFNSPHFDKVTKNVSRVCYESYDPLTYINLNSSVCRRNGGNCRHAPQVMPCWRRAEHARASRPPSRWCAQRSVPLKKYGKGICRRWREGPFCRRQMTQKKRRGPHRGHRCQRIESPPRYGARRAPLRPFPCLGTSELPWSSGPRSGRCCPAAHPCDGGN